MTMYAPYKDDVVLSVGETGCVHERPHRFETGDDGQPVKVYDRSPWAVDCEICEPVLRRQGEWVTHPTEMKLSQLELKEKQLLEEQGNVTVQAMAQALAKSAQQMIATGASA